MRVAIGVAVTFLLAMPATAQTYVTYACADGTNIPVEFYGTPRSVAVQIDGKSIILPQKLFSISGARYAEGGLSLRISRKTISLKRRGQRRITCSAE